MTHSDITHLWDYWVYVSRPAQDSVNVALPLAQHALKLDEADPMAHFVTGCALMLSGDVDEAARGRPGWDLSM